MIVSEPVTSMSPVVAVFNVCVTVSGELPWSVSESLKACPPPLNVSPPAAIGFPPEKSTVSVSSFEPPLRTFMLPKSSVRPPVVYWSVPSTSHAAAELMPLSESVVVAEPPTAPSMLEKPPVMDPSVPSNPSVVPAACSTTAWGVA